MNTLTARIPFYFQDGRGVFDVTNLRKETTGYYSMLPLFGVTSNLKLSKRKEIALSFRQQENWAIALKQRNLYTIACTNNFESSLGNLIW